MIEEGTEVGLDQGPAHGRDQEGQDPGIGKLQN